MFNHEPSDYECPFCLRMTSSQEIVRQTERATSFVSPRWWPNNHGHVLVVPNEHYESLYDLPSEYGHAVHDLVREVALAIRHTYDCTGVSTRQHNEPDGNQDVWHLHVHVFPRYADDQLYASRPMPEFVTVEQRRPYVEKLREYFESHRFEPE